MSPSSLVGAAHRPPPALTVADLLPAAGPGAQLHGPATGAVTDVTHDSRRAGPGVLFACKPGARADGHDFAPSAVAAGSPALLVERRLDLPVAQLQARSVAAALGPVAARVHGDPSAALLLCGVTGTNGKTTTAFLLESILRTAGHTTGLIGTVTTRIAGAPLPGVRTTPEASDLQRLFAKMRAAGVTAAAMEVSSHGLALGRVAGTRFTVAAFTNLSQDHLDFHADMGDYYAAKRSLFVPAHTSVAVINTDDPWGRRLAAETATEVTTFSPSGRRADAVATDVVTTAGGSRFTAVVDGRAVAVTTRLVGDYNVANALCALVVAVRAGVDPATAAGGIAALAGVPGRMEPVEAGQPFTVLVDYAHTPEAVDNMLRCARRLAAGKVIVVVGCGGDRDALKRPLMGRAAASGADLAVLTTDNPRSENPQGILDAVVSGARTVPGARWIARLDRREAIAEALRAASAGDVVVVAGKGHETSQEFAGAVVAFDDREVARALLTEEQP